MFGIVTKAFVARGALIAEMPEGKACFGLCERCVWTLDENAMIMMRAKRELYLFPLKNPLDQIVLKTVGILWSKTLLVSVIDYHLFCFNNF